LLVGVGPPAAAFGKHVGFAQTGWDDVEPGVEREVVSARVSRESDLVAGVTQRHADTEHGRDVADTRRRAQQDTHDGPLTLTRP
jgi:hypothetical protein